MLSALAPARRRLVLAVAGLAAALLVALVTLVLHRAAGAGAPGEATAPVPQDRPGPVLLVPGYGGSMSELALMAARLRARRQGRHDRPRCPTTGSATCGTRPARLGAAATTARSPHRRPLGRRGRLLRRRGGRPATGCRSSTGGEQARRMVTLGSPHHGTELAALGIALRRRVPVACQQLLPDQPVLARARPHGHRGRSGPVVSIWTDAGRRGAPAGLGPARGRAEHHRAGRLRRVAGATTAACRAIRWCRAWSVPSWAPGRPARSASPTAAGSPDDRVSRRPASAGDVLGGEVGPRGAEQHDDVDGLEGDAALDVAPEDRVAEQVDERQPVPGRQVRAAAPGRRRG